MKTVLLLGGPAAGQRVEVHGGMTSYPAPGFFEFYKVVPMCSHGEVHWFGVLDGADPLALLIAGYAPVAAERSGVLTNSGDIRDTVGILVVALDKIEAIGDREVDTTAQDCAEIARVALERSGWVRT